MSLTLDPAKLARREADEAGDYYQVGQAFGLLTKAASSRPVASPVLHGRLIVPQSGWALLTVPNALVRGLFDAMDETGIELPPGHQGGPFVAHISVIRGEEIDKLGGPDKISERGHPFTYQLGPIMSVEPKGWSEMSRVWFVKVISPELKALRKSYGLSPLPNGDHDFHISIAVRKKNVLNPGPASKAAAADDDDDPDDDGPGGGDKKEIRMPMVMQRIVITKMTFGKPDEGMDDFMERLRKRRDKPVAKTAAVKTAAGMAQFAKTFKQVIPTLADAGRQTIGRARPALADLGRNALGGAEPTLGNLGRFVSSVPAGQKFAPTIGQGLKNTARAAVRFRYPVLDRPPGVKSMPRVLDRTRAWAGTGLRGGSLVSMGLSAPTIANAALRGYPNMVGEWTAGLAGRPQDKRESQGSDARGSCRASTAIWPTTP